MSYVDKINSIKKSILSAGRHFKIIWRPADRVGDETRGKEMKARNQHLRKECKQAQVSSRKERERGGR